MKIQFAPGVELEEYYDRSVFNGTPSALVAAGVLKQGWLPGEPGNQKTTANIVLDAEGSGVVLPSHSQVKKCEGDFGFLRIWKSGNLIHVHKFRPREEREQKEAENRVSCTKETWQVHKDFSTQQRDFPGEWKGAVAYELERITNLVNGRAVYEGFPDIEMTEEDRRAIHEAAAHLVSAIKSSTPFVRPSRQATGNVICLADLAHRGMRKTS